MISYEESDGHTALLVEGARRIGKSTAVEAFLTTNNFTQVDLVKRDILKLYENDFMKFDSTGRASLLFDHIPAELQDSKTANVAYHANAPEAGLSQNIDLEKFKLFVCDTGLFVTLCFKDTDIFCIPLYLVPFI